MTQVLSNGEIFGKTVHIFGKAALRWIKDAIARRCVFLDDEFAAPCQMAPSTSLTQKWIFLFTSTLDAGNLPMPASDGWTTMH
ncbi:MAG: hypothetical protein PVH87_08200 [Desulfobacteraceae bacterium]|jgi:hypothetical protein